MKGAMPARHMHVDEVDRRLARAPVARRAVSAWTALAIAPIPSAGTDHALYRLGTPWPYDSPHRAATPQVDKEDAWLPDWPRTCRWPSRSHWRKGAPARDPRGRGRSRRGSEVSM